MAHSQKDLSLARKLQATLRSIDNGFYDGIDFIRLTNYGLITCRRVNKTSMGKRVTVGHTYHLTDKARKFLSVVV